MNNSSTITIIASLGPQTIYSVYMEDCANILKMKTEDQVQGFRTVLVQLDTHNRLKRLKYQTGGKSFNTLIAQMLDIGEQRILEDAAAEEALLINTQK